MLVVHKLRHVVSKGLPASLNSWTATPQDDFSPRNLLLLRLPIDPLGDLSFLLINVLLSIATIFPLHVCICQAVDVCLTFISNPEFSMQLGKDLRMLKVCFAISVAISSTFWWILPHYLLTTFQLSNLTKQLHFFLLQPPNPFIKQNWSDLRFEHWRKSSRSRNTIYQRA